MTSIEDRFIHLLKEITTLQWVRESLPSHSKYYEGLKKKLEKQVQLRRFSERELKNYRIAKDQRKSSTKSYSNVIESVRFYENAIQEIESQLNQAKIMMQELNVEKEKLDQLCTQLNQLYQEIQQDEIDPFENQLKNDVAELSRDIPLSKKKIEVYKQAQAKLYQAREYIETAMKSLPGASTFMDRQAIISLNGHHKSSIFNNISLIDDPLKKADKIAQQSYQLILEASQLCPEDVPNIPHTSIDSSNVISLLTNYRGYRLKIESTLRTQLNPRLHSLENHLNVAKYQYEQRTIEWIDYQIITLEQYLRLNGLITQNLDVEISRLRMGSRAAMMAVAAEETTGRVTVDDALEISLQTDDLPLYSGSGSSSSNNSSGRNSTEDFLQVNNNLPSYALDNSDTSSNSNSNNDPPAYFQ